MNSKSIFSQYLKELHTATQQGDAREESYYPTLAKMLETFSHEKGKSEISVTTLPRSTDAGNPDFRLWNGRDRIVGYIEAKKPTEERLDYIEQTEQLKRYRSTFPNLILTNFLEFRFYRNGERVETVQVGRPAILTRVKAKPPVEKVDELEALLERFLDFSLPKTFTAESLATQLAKRTRFLRDVIEQELREEKDSPGVLTGFFEAFDKFLIGSLNHEDFADLFAQTITYGLFAARTRAGEDFNRQTAYSHIPHTIGVLRDLFKFISVEDLSKELAWCVDDIAEVLAVADAPGILDRYYHEGKGSDPIVHFYETFLAQYDPQERERRGVYYTPEPVVGYIVRSLHRILKDDFDKPDGLASEGVTLLDPAAGTMTFVARAAEQAVAEFEEKYGSGSREDFIRRHVLKNFYAFELMMAPYSVGHLKMGFYLEELGHRLSDDERVPFYLTNTLDMEELETSRLPGFSALAEESHLAGKVKKQTPILVILGNPPYSGHSTNIGEWIRGLIDDYKQVDGKPLGEKNPKWLQDDYVKFLRFAQWKIDRAGSGVVGMITNHSYLDNPTFRGMRQSLMQSFDEIYILDLHGNSLKKETCPDGSPDKNVFDIRQGVAIAFFIKHKGKSKKKPAVYHSEVWGLRESKYHWLNQKEKSNTKWKKIKPHTPFYLFIQRDETFIENYENFSSVKQIFPISGVGMTTARDSFVIDTNKNSLLNRVRLFKNSSYSDDELHNFFQIRKKKGWSIRRAWQMLQDLDEKELKNCIKLISYRPFDIQWIFYHDSLVWRTVKKVMHHMLAGENIALITMRQVSLNESYTHFLVTNLLVDNRTFVSSKGVTLVSPLYLYPSEEKEDLFAYHEPEERRPNLHPGLLEALKKAYKRTPKPEQIFYYIYAVLYAPAYREKYAEFLRMDFPRVPFTADLKLFKKLAALGEKLTELHLLKSKALNKPTCRFEGKGDSLVEKSKSKGFGYDEDEQRMYINKNQYFGPIPPEVHEYQVGGYQVCEKWLKDRKERKLTVDEIRTYCRIVTALGKTIEIQEKIDELYPEVEKDVIEMELGEK